MQTNLIGWKANDVAVDYAKMIARRASDNDTYRVVVEAFIKAVFANAERDRLKKQIDALCGSATPVQDKTYDAV